MRDDDAMRLIREAAQLIERPGDNTAVIYLRITPDGERIRIDSADEISALEAVRMGLAALHSEEARILAESCSTTA